MRQSHKKYADSTVLTQTVGIIISDRFLRNKKPEKFFFRFVKEAQTGFEPVDTGVADHCLTTWLLRHYEIVEKSFSDFSVTPTGIEPVLPP